MTFSSAHLSTVLKYGGISFIAGAVNHGFFSEARSLWTAGFGVLFYLAGAWIEMRSQTDQSDQSKTWRDVLGAGIIFSVGIGFFTGGLQHFPDSPARSVWVVPLGFALSVLAMYVMEGHKRSSARRALMYGVIALAVVTVGSVAAWRVLGDAGLGHAHDHGAVSNGHSHSHADSAPAAAAPSLREVSIEMLDSMTFVPAQLQVKQGETIRFNVINRGKVRHEWVIGSEQELLAHAQAMKQAKADAHDHSHAGHNAISLAAGEQGSLAYTFNASQSLLMACFEPGHYEAGMRGTIQVVPADQ